MLTKSILYRKNRIEFVINSLVNFYYKIFFYKIDILDSDLFLFAVEKYFLFFFDFFVVENKVELFISTFFMKTLNFFKFFVFKKFKLVKFNKLLNNNYIYIYFKLCIFFFKFKWFLKLLIYLFIFIYVFYLKVGINYAFDFFSIIPFIF